MMAFCTLVDSMCKIRETVYTCRMHTSTHCIYDKIWQLIQQVDGYVREYQYGSTSTGTRNQHGKGISMYAWLLILHALKLKQKFLSPV